MLNILLFSISTTYDNDQYYDYCFLNNLLVRFGVNLEIQTKIMFRCGMCKTIDFFSLILEKNSKASQQGCVKCRSYKNFTSVEKISDHFFSS